MRNDVFANGVCYLQLEFDLEGLPDAAFDLLPLYGDALVKMGAAGMDYVRMAERVAAHTGGIGFAAGADGLVQGPGAVRRSAAFSLKALDGALEPALAVLRDLLFEPDFADRERLRDVVVQAHAAHRGALVEDGVGLALRHAGRGLGERGRLLERMGGLPQVRLVERWARDFDAHFEALRDGLAALTRQFLNRRAFAASFTGSGPAAQAARKALDGWAAAMRDEPLAPGARDPFVQAAPPREGLAAPMEVAFCAQVLPAPHLSHPDTPALTVASRILSLGYMWDEVRLKGGAYDAGALYGPLDGNFCCYSYRDPWIRKTLARFKGLKEFVARANWSQLEIDRAIIGAAKHGEKPIRPGEATAAALWRHTHGDTPARREARHAALLDVTPADAKRAAAELLERQDELAAVCVVSSRAMLEQANAEPGDGQLAVEDILTT
ncbi:MAG: hypothetical protein M5U26_01400 [Planctomycetota bacterium]|nr:hypothetical protein [Planctomycetota bacterium]